MKQQQQQQGTLAQEQQGNLQDQHEVLQQQPGTLAQEPQGPTGSTRGAGAAAAGHTGT
jgi:hypothetical protein